ncbi:aminopeptidase [Deinococcus arcticus]|nr:aminopeptidase [Deinococcus arcticus]
MIRTVRVVTLALLGSLGLSGCADLGYLVQAAGGQLDLLRRARPLDQARQDPALSPETRRKLNLAAQVRAFAVAPPAQGGLGLPDHGSFRDYVDVGRPYVVWNVFSAPEFSVALDTACFPVAGCVAYRGYFNEAQAQADAEGRRAAGRDVIVGGVSAYSTLGYLKDPLLSTMLLYPDATLIRTIIHELSHPSVYVPGDTVFNESYATAVEEEGMRRYLAAHGTPDLRAADGLAQERQAAFQALLLDSRQALEALYAQGGLSDDERRARKAEVLQAAQNRYAALRASWGGYAGYDTFFAQGLNNAALGAVAAYAALVPEFQALLARVGGDLGTFITAARACGARPQPERAACLRGG